MIEAIAEQTAELRIVPHSATMDAACRDLLTRCSSGEAYQLDGFHLTKFTVLPGLNGGQLIVGTLPDGQVVRAFVPPATEANVFVTLEPSP